ncbi:MAG TPA: FlgD immunoglobulin-like domain containing protein [Candidatus Krumholzibacteria bacterium]|nr:FlgD immunoglobulin-like domain containing protein [Candidatus Krumholzibacteria bacterium]
MAGILSRIRVGAGVVAAVVGLAGPPARAQCFDYALPDTAPPTTHFDIFLQGIADFRAQGPLAWLALTDYGGIASLDMTDPVAPVPVAQIDLPVFETYRIALAGDVAVLSYSNWTSFGLVFVDIADPADPQFLYDYEAPTGWIYGLAARDTLLFAALPNPGALQVIDIADPMAPVVLGQVQLGYGAAELTLDGDRAYVVGDNDVFIVDVMDPAAPALLGNLPIQVQDGRTTLPRNIAVSGPLAFVGTSVGAAGGLQVFDVTDPAAAAWTGATLLAGAGASLQVDGSIAYVATAQHGLAVIDVADPRAPQVIGGATYPGTVLWGELRLIGDAVVTGEGGLFIQPRHCGSAPSNAPLPGPAGLAARAVPNPFNPRTEIRFTLPEPLAATVEILDVRGRRVRTLVGDRVLAAGAQALSWDGCDARGQFMASGAYLCRIRAGGYASTVALSLVR